MSISRERSQSPDPIPPEGAQHIDNVIKVFSTATTISPSYREVSTQPATTTSITPSECARELENIEAIVELAMKEITRLKNRVCMERIRRMNKK